jgi:hypothetical protein
MYETRQVEAWTELLDKLVGMVGTEVEVLVSGADREPPEFVSFEGTMQSNASLVDIDTPLEVLSLYFGRTAMRLHAEHFRGARWSTAPNGTHSLELEIGNVSIAMRAEIPPVSPLE